MESLLKCCLCLNNFDSVKFIPQILNCGHTICKICIEKLIKTHIENDIKNFYCPIDKKIISEKIENNFPLNKIIIDLIEINGNNFFNLNLNEINNEINSDFSIINNAFFFCENFNKKNNENFKIIKNFSNFLLNNKIYFYNNLKNLYENIINLIIKEKEKNLKILDDFYNKKINENNLIEKILFNYKIIVENSMKKIIELKEQKFKKISIVDQLNLINDLNLNQLNNKNKNSEIENYIKNINNNNLNPIFNVDENILIYTKKLLNFIQIEFPNFNLNENNLNSNDFNLNSNDFNNFNIDNLNFSFSNIKISFSFIWIQPNSQKIYKFLGKNHWNLIKYSNPNQIKFNNYFKITKLNNFKFLISGGIKNNLSSNEVFLLNLSQKNSELNVLKNMIFPRRAHGAILIKNNVFFVCGGIDNFNNCMKKCEIFDIKNNFWKESSEMIIAKCNLSLICVNENLIFNFGGRLKNENLNNIFENYSNSIEIYDYLLNSWKIINIKLPFSIECISLNLLNNQKEILLCGGYSPKFGIINYCFLFNIENYNIKLLADQNIKKPGFCVFDSIKNGNNFHIFLGGIENFPEHIIFKYENENDS
jgi:tripartite motif-containing protein 32